MGSPATAINWLCDITCQDGDLHSEQLSLEKLAATGVNEKQHRNYFFQQTKTVEMYEKHVLN